MKTKTETYERHFRHPSTLEGVGLYCDKRGEHNYAVFCYRGSEQCNNVPTDLQRGGVSYARAAWKNIQDRLLSQGFVVVE